MQGDRDICYSLIFAVCEGRLERVRELISSFGLSYSQNWEDGYVLLCDALKNNHREVAKLLLTNASKVNSINENPSTTPLHFAVRNSDIEIVEMLLDRGANIDAECKDGTTPLHGAFEWHKMGIVELLLNRGARVDAKGKYGKTYLHTAADAGCLPIVEHLLKHGADVNSECTYDGKKRCTPLYLAVINNHETVVKLLLKFGANVDAQDQDGKTILYFAVEKGYSLIIQHLLNHSPDVNNTSNRNAFNVAVCGCGEFYIEIAENLLQYGFTVNLEYGDNCKLLHSAVEKGYLKIVEELLKYGADVNYTNEHDSTALHIASWHHKVEILEVLLKFGANIHSKDKNGTTALHVASYYNPELYTFSYCFDEVVSQDEDSGAKIVEVLLKFGADIDSKAGDGRTALHIASDYSTPKVVEVLLEFGADIDSKDGDGRTAFHIASGKSSTEIVEVLVEFGADINSKDPYGKTALLSASEDGDERFVEVLLELGADIHPQDEDGNTAPHIACTNYFEGVESSVEIFKRYAVKVKTANLYVRNKNLLSISSDEKLNEFRNECEKEVACMKSEKVGNADISFYDILTKGINQLAIYAGNESIVQVFGSNNYERKFPIYATLINNNFRKGKRRKQLMERGNTIFYFFTNSLGIPYDCTEKIFNYLSNVDLRTIMNACKPISVSSPNTDNK